MSESTEQDSNAEAKQQCTSLYRTNTYTATVSSQAQKIVHIAETHVTNCVAGNGFIKALCNGQLHRQSVQPRLLLLPFRTGSQVKRQGEAAGARRLRSPGCAAGGLRGQGTGHRRSVRVRPQV
jgi:hypothetical protein